MRILNKLAKLASPAYRRKLMRRSYRIGMPKSENNNVLYYVDQLSSAITECRAVSFYYYQLNYHKRREFLNEGQPYKLFPENLLWRDEKYYLIAATDTWEHMHFRVDRMSELRVLDSVREGNKIYNTGELKNYARSTFAMEKGRSILITLLCEKDCADEIFERFGMNTSVYAVTETHFKADISAAPGMQLYAWVFSQNGKVRILRTEYAQTEMQLLCTQRFLDIIRNDCTYFRTVILL